MTRVLSTVALGASSKLLHCRYNQESCLGKPCEGCFCLVSVFGFWMGAIGFSFGSVSLMASGSVSFGKVGIKCIVFDSDFLFSCSSTSHIHKLLLLLLCEK